MELVITLLYLQVLRCSPLLGASQLSHLFDDVFLGEAILDPLWPAKDSTAILDPGLSLLWGILEQELVLNLGFLGTLGTVGASHEILPCERFGVGTYVFWMCHSGVRRSWFLGGG